MPPEHQRARDIDARVGSGDNADEEREREVVDFAAAEKDRSAMVARNTVPEVMIVRLRVWLSAWFINFAECAAHAEPQVFADTVKDHDGVVDGEADDGQHRSQWWR